MRILHERKRRVRTIMHAYDFGLLFIRLPKNPNRPKIIMWIKKRESKYKCSHFRISSSHVRMLYAILLYKNALGLFSLCVFCCVPCFFHSLVYQTHGPNFSLPSSHLAVCVRNGCRLHIHTYARRHACVHFKRVIVHTSSAMAFSLFGNLEFYPKRSKNRRKWLTTSSTTQASTLTHAVVLRSWIGNVGEGSPVCIRHSFYLNNFLSSSLETTYRQWVIKQPKTVWNCSQSKNRTRHIYMNGK